MLDFVGTSQNDGFGTIGTRQMRRWSAKKGNEIP
jgi:hypothetical protein